MTPDSVRDTQDPLQSPPDDVSRVPYTYDADLVIRHPAIDPVRITAVLGVAPRGSWMAGEPRRTPAGTTLPGVRAETYWIASDRTEGSRAFFDGILAWLDLLERHGDFTRELSRTGGRVDLRIALNGVHNIGDDISAAALARMAALDVGLGLEVFPDYQN